MGELLTGAAIALISYAIGYRVCLHRHRHRFHLNLCTMCRREPVDSPTAICEPCFINGGPR
jgi:hypothetical protein